MNKKKLPTILYVIKGPFGALGTTASYMLPTIANKSGCSVTIISFSEITTRGVVCGQTPIKLYEYKNKTLSEKIKIIRHAIKTLQPDIVHMFKINRFYVYPFFCTVANGHKPKWLIDVRSPPVSGTKKTVFSHATDPVKNFIKQAGFTAISSHVLKSAQDFFYLVYKPVYEVPLGVAYDKIKKKQWPENQKIQKISKFVYIGSMAKQRRLYVLIDGIRKACNLLESRSNFHVDFYGQGGALETLQKQVQQLDLDRCVSFNGIIEQEQLFKVLSKYDAGIGYVPYEQYMFAPALKVVEYMAANIAVIASDTQGIQIHVKDGFNGILFKNTPESIAEKIIISVTNGYPSDFLREGLVTAKKNSWNVVVQTHLLPLYNRLIS